MVAATIEQQVQKVRASGQQDFGWASASRVPQTHYTPQKTIFQPRPLVWDVAAANEKFDATCHAVLVEKYTRMLCRICGFPDCGCKGCAERQRIKAGREAGAKTTARHNHEAGCWKQGDSGNPGNQDPIEKKPEWKQQRLEAWAAKGCTLALRWHKQCGEYEFH